MVADCPWWRVVTGAGCLWWQVVIRGGLSPGRIVHGGRLSMVAGCLGASCHPGQVVSGGRLSWGRLSRVGFHRGRLSLGTMSLHQEKS